MKPFTRRSPAVHPPSGGGAALRWQLPSEQEYPGAHSLSEVQLVKHAPLRQIVPPGQISDGGAGPHAPALQVPLGTISVPEQPPQVRALCGAPLGTAEQVPSRLATSHAMQVAVQAVLQQ